MKLSWKIKKDDGWSCENLYVGKNFVATYNHSLIREDPNGDFYGQIIVPIIPAKLKRCYGTREDVKTFLENSIKIWIENLKEKRGKK